MRYKSKHSCVKTNSLAFVWIFIVALLPASASYQFSFFFYIIFYIILHHFLLFFISLACIDLFSIPIHSTGAYSFRKEDQPKRISYIGPKSFPQIKMNSWQSSSDTNKSYIFTHDHTAKFDKATINRSDSANNCDLGNSPQQGFLVVVPRNQTIDRRTSSSRSLCGTDLNFTCTSQPSPFLQRGHRYLFALRSAISFHHYSHITVDVVAGASTYAKQRASVWRPSSRIGTRLSTGVGGTCAGLLRPVAPDF